MISDIRVRVLLCTRPHYACVRGYVFACTKKVSTNTGIAVQNYVTAESAYVLVAPANSDDVAELDPLYVLDKVFTLLRLCLQPHPDGDALIYTVSLSELCAIILSCTCDSRRVTSTCALQLTLCSRPARSLCPVHSSLARVYPSLACVDFPPSRTSTHCLPARVC